MLTYTFKKLSKSKMNTFNVIYIKIKHIAVMKAKVKKYTENNDREINCL